MTTSFGFNQTNKSVENIYITKQLNPNQQISAQSYKASTSIIYVSRVINKSN